jgi:hypothetical protein
VRRLDAESFGGLLHRPAELSTELAHPVSELGGHAAELRRLSVMGRLENAVTG